MRIKVTAEHIKAGCKQSAFNCPIAKAMQKATGLAALNCSVGSDRCSIFRCSIFSSGLTLGVHPPLPPIAQKFIQDFDAGRPVQPFEFEIPYEVPG